MTDDNERDWKDLISKADWWGPGHKRAIIAADLELKARRKFCKVVEDIFDGRVVTDPGGSLYSHYTADIMQALLIMQEESK